MQCLSQFDRSVIKQMMAFAIAKSVLDGKRIYYGVIDGQGTLRLNQAYKDCFGQNAWDELEEEFCGYNRM